MPRSAHADEDDRHVVVADCLRLSQTRDETLEVARRSQSRKRGPGFLTAFILLQKPGSQGIGHQEKEIARYPCSLGAKSADSARSPDAADQIGRVAEGGGAINGESPHERIVANVEEAGVADGDSGPRTG